MEVKTRELDDIIIFDIKGNIRRHGEHAVPLYPLVKDKLEAGKRNLLLNLSGINDIDSFGIGELLSCFKLTTSAGGKLKIINVPQKIRILFRVTMIEKIFEIYDDEVKAINSFS